MTGRFQLVLNVHETIILDYTFTATWGACFQVSRSDGHREIGDEVISCFSGAV
jgi:hypothetical protein